MALTLENAWQGRSHDCSFHRMGGNSLPYQLPGFKEGTKICELSVSHTNRKDNVVLKLLLQTLFFQTEKESFFTVHEHVWQ